MSATAVAGLLLRYQLRLTNDSADSAKALFAADARLEWHNFCAEKQKAVIQSGSNSLDCTGYGPEPSFIDPRVSSRSLIDVSRNADDTGWDARIFSEGFAGKATRAVETVLPF